MIKQYISTRTQNKASGGFECIATSGEFNAEQTRQLDKFAAAYGIKATDRSGARIPITMKFSVGKEGNFAIGRNSFVDGKKPTHISHQFLFEGDSTFDLVVSPDEIMRLPFISDESECALISDSVALMRSPMPVKDLSAAMKPFGITEDIFCDIISAVYDCIANSRKLFIVLASQFDDNIVECTSLLYHIFRYLPYQMRMLLGFDTCYSYITSKSCIHISFINKNDIILADDGTPMIGEHNCNSDYVLTGGTLLHVKDRSDCKRGILQNGLRKYISSEFGGKSCETELQTVFDSLYSLSRGIPFGFFDNPTVYDAMFAAMTAVAGGELSRENADALLRFYIAVSPRLTGDAADFWGNAVFAYLNDYESSSDDAYILTVLAAICCASDQSAEYILPMLQQKLAFSLKNEGASAIKRYETAITSADSDGSFYLMQRVFSFTRITQKALIAFKLGECNSPGEVCTAAAVLAKTLCIGNEMVSAEQEITSDAASRISKMTVTCDDIVVMQRLLSNEIDESSRSVIHNIADRSLNMLQYAELDPTWFMSVRLGGDFVPKTPGGAAIMLLHDILIDTSASDISHYLAKYSYLSIDERINAGVAAGDTLISMLTDGRLTLKSALYPTVIMLSRDERFDCELISSILSHYPSEIPGFIRYFGTKLDSVKDPSACLAELLSSIRGICTEKADQIDIKATIVAVNDIRKSGVKCDNASEFNAAIYDAAASAKPSLPVIDNIARRSALSANSKSKANNKYYLIVAAAILLGIAILLLAITLDTGKGQAEPSFELYIGNQKLEFVEYDPATTDSAERISLAEACINGSISFSDRLTVKIGDGNVKFLEYTQKNLVAAADTYTIGDFSNLVGNKDNVYYITLTNVTADLHRVYICFDVRYEDGSRIYYGVCLQR